MSDDFKLPLQEVKGTTGKKITLSSDFEKLVRLSSNRGLGMTENALKGAWKHVSVKEKPSETTLDTLALFAELQSWDDFKQTLHDESNGDLEDEDHSRRLHCGRD